MTVYERELLRFLVAYQLRAHRVFRWAILDAICDWIDSSAKSSGALAFCIQLTCGDVVPVPVSQQLRRVLGPRMVKNVACLRCPVGKWTASCPLNTRCCTGLQLWRAVCYPLCSASGFLVDSSSTIRARTSSICTRVLNSSRLNWRLDGTVWCGLRYVEGLGRSTPARTLGEPARIRRDVRNIGIP